MSQKTILVVDNDPLFQKELSADLISAGYRVITADNPQDAIAKALTDRSIDLLLIDQRLNNNADPSDHSGFEVAAKAPSHLPKIIMTNYPTPEEAVDALRRRLDEQPLATDYIQKARGSQQILDRIQVQLLHAKQRTLEVETQHYQRAATNAQILFYASLTVSIIGMIAFLVSLFTMLSTPASISGITAAASAINSVVSYLLFRRVDVADARLEASRARLTTTDALSNIIDACDQISNQRMRDQCIKDALDNARQVLLKMDMPE